MPTSQQQPPGDPSPAAAAASVHSFIPDVLKPVEPLDPPPSAKSVANAARRIAVEYASEVQSSLASLPCFVSSSLRFYARHPWTARGELLSGLAIGAMAVPQSVAFALLGNMPIASGLYASALLPIVCSSLTSRGGTIAGSAAATAAIIRLITDEGGQLGHLSMGERQAFVAPMLMVVAALQVVLALINASRWIRLLPRTAFAGFMNALAIIIAISQFETFQYCPTGPYSSCKKAARQWLPLSSLECWLTIIHVLFAMALMFGMPRVPRLGKLIPGSFAALVLTAALEEGIFRAAIGSSTRNVGETATLPTQLPSFHVPALPAGSEGAVGLLIQCAASITAVAMLQSLLSLHMVSHANGQAVTDRMGNQETLAQAAGNVVCAFFQGLGGSGVIGPSTINLLNGGRHRLSAVFSGVVMLLIIAVAAPAIELVPMAGLAGILFAMVTQMFQWETFTVLRAGNNSDRLIIVLATALGVAWDLAWATLVGCALAACFFSFQAPDLLRVDAKFVQRQRAAAGLLVSTGSSPDVDAEVARQARAACAEEDAHDPGAVVVHVHEPPEEGEPLEKDAPRPATSEASVADATPPPNLFRSQSTSNSRDSQAACSSVELQSLPSSAQPTPESVVRALSRPLEPSAATCVKVYEIRGPISYCTASHFRSCFSVSADPAHVLLDFSTAAIRDHSGLWSVRELLHAYASRAATAGGPVTVTTRGFASAAAGLGPTDWMRVLRPFQVLEAAPVCIEEEDSDAVAAAGAKCKSDQIESDPQWQRAPSLPSVAKQDPNLSTSPMFEASPPPQSSLATPAPPSASPALSDPSPSSPMPLLRSHANVHDDVAPRFHLDDAHFAPATSSHSNA